MSDAYEIFSMSSIRQKIILEILPAVFESTYPSPEFNRMMGRGPYEARYLDKLLTPPSSYTTCVELPGYVGQMLGETGWSGLSNCRTLGRKNNPNCWVDFTGEERPLPGDIYALLEHSITETQPEGLLVHIGVIVEVGDNNIWETADAGQGVRPVQQALYVQRMFDPDKGTLFPGGTDKHGNPVTGRIAGWLDIDKYFDPYAEQDSDDPYA